MHNEKHVYQQKIDAKLKEWDAEVDLLKAKGEGLTADAKIEVDKKIEQLSKTRDELSAYWDEISDKAEDTWDHIKDEAEEKWDKLSKAFSAFKDELKS